MCSAFEEEEEREEEGAEEDEEEERGQAEAEARLVRNSPPSPPLLPSLFLPHFASAPALACHCRECAAYSVQYTVYLGAVCSVHTYSVQLSHTTERTCRVLRAGCLSLLCAKGYTIPYTVLYRIYPF